MQFELVPSGFDYIVGTGRKRKLVWQNKGKIYCLIVILSILIIGATSVLLGKFLVATFIMNMVMLVSLYVVFRSLGHGRFKVFPYAKDIWEWSMFISEYTERHTVELLKDLNEYRNLSNFVNVPELVQSTIDMLKLRHEKKISIPDVEAYNRQLVELMELCKANESPSYSVDTYDLTLENALEVARNVRKDML